MIYAVVKSLAFAYPCGSFSSAPVRLALIAMQLKNTFYSTTGMSGIVGTIRQFALRQTRIARMPTPVGGDKATKSVLPSNGAKIAPIDVAQPVLN